MYARVISPFEYEIDLKQVAGDIRQQAKVLFEAFPFDIMRRYGKKIVFLAELAKASPRNWIEEGHPQRYDYLNHDRLFYDDLGFAIGNIEYHVKD